MERVMVMGDLLKSTIKEDSLKGVDVVVGLSWLGTESKRADK